MMLFEFSIDLDNELNRLIGRHKVVVPIAVINELKFLSQKNKGKTSYKAKASLELVKKYEKVKLDIDLKADDAVFELARQLDGFVVTNDIGLKKRLRAANLHVVFLRGKKKLVLE
jgi:rRNA-processing protein FCF1